MEKKQTRGAWFSSNGKKKRMKKTAGPKKRAKKAANDDDMQQDHQDRHREGVVSKSGGEMWSTHTRNLAWHANPDWHGGHGAKIAYCCILVYYTLCKFKLWNV